ncbi:MAG TPA: hemerythrin domain-containing protein [Candidatus Binatia bacterium]|jgi:hemerythrin-like domain-containing protein
MARSSTTRGRAAATRKAPRRRITATQLLRNDHAAVKQLFRRFEKAGDRAHESKQKLFEEIQQELETHTKIEESIFYPAVEHEVAGSGDEVHEAIEEHAVVKSLLSELGATAPQDDEFDARMKVLIENVEHHIQEEEGEMFPRVEQLPERRLLELGSEMRARKESLQQSFVQRIVHGVSEALFGSDQEPPARARRARPPRSTDKKSGGSRRRSRAAATTTTKSRPRTTRATKSRARAAGTPKPRRRGTRAQTARKR